MSDVLHIIGAGPMAIEYAKILKALNVQFKVIGRSQASCDRFTESTGVSCVSGGFDKWYSEVQSIPSKVIVAVSEENLGDVTEKLMKRSCPSILVEKPGAATYSELSKLVQVQKNSESRVLIGYNRRFYSSVQKAQELIKEDGGVKSFFFEFTEWGHLIREKVCPDLVKEEWLWHNSTHVMDMAFYLGGFPEKMSSYKSGSLDWHSRGAVYSGSGISTAGALFSYMANWAAPGRWVVEILTSKRRFIFKPLETLQVQKIGSVAVESIAIDDSKDKDFKPGLHDQTKAFIEGEYKKLLTLNEQFQHMKWYQKIETGE